MDHKYRVPFIGGDDVFTGFGSLNYRVKKLAKGKTLYYEDVEDTILGVIKGKLKVVIGNDEGDEIIVRYISENSFCAPFLPIVVDIFIVKLVMEEDCELAYFDKNELYDCICSSRDMFEKLVNDLGKRHAVMYSTMLDAIYETSRNRVYNLIYQMALNSQIKTDDDLIIIDNFPSKRDISLITGVHRSNVYKYIAKLENMEIIKKKKHGLLIKDMEQLKILIQEGSKAQDD